MNKLFWGFWSVLTCFLIFACFYTSNNEQENRTIIKTTTNCHDTLIEIETIKLIPCTELNKDYKSSTIIESQPDVLFKDGKTCDTIRRTTIEYY